MKLFKLSNPYFFLSCISLLSIFILFFFNGTGNEADSFHHHLIAKFSWDHPELLFDHWGKPLYTLLSSPFAQFGVLGSKLFNVLLSLIAMYYAYKILLKFKIDSAVWVLPLFFLIPLNFQTTFSAFTEPLFAAILTLSIYLALNRQLFWSVILISFSPMVRSEGLVILLVFAAYLIYSKAWKYLPLLVLGQFIYAITGSIFMGKSIGWVFGEIPYASLASPYGEGNISHFPEQLFYMLGPVLLSLFLIGLIAIPLRKEARNREFIFLILGSFIIFFLFHSISWYMGWFNSMGLKRVFGAVTPIMAILIILGLDTLIFRIKSANIRMSMTLIFLIATLGLLFSKGPAGIKWKQEMNLSMPQQQAKLVSDFVSKNELNNSRLLFSDRYLARGLGIDPYDPNVFRLLDQNSLDQIKTGDLIIWDNWHSVIDFGLSLEKIEAKSELQKVKEFSDESTSRKVQYVIFKAN